MPDLFPLTSAELVTINAIEALDDLCREFDLDDVKVHGAMKQERYGYKGMADVMYRGEPNRSVLVALLPLHGTGLKPPQSQAEAGHLALRRHDDQTHEFVFNLSHPQSLFVERYSSQHNMGRCPQLLCDRLFASHYTQYELETELYQNPIEPQGIVFRAHDVHALYNPSDKNTLLLLVHPIKRGEPLIKPFQHMLLQESGEKFELAIDPRNGNIL